MSDTTWVYIFTTYIVVLALVVMYECYGVMRRRRLSVNEIAMRLRDKWNSKRLL